MRRATIVAAALSTLAACSLLTDLSGLSGGAAGSDGGPEATAPVDGGVDAEPNTDGGSDGAEAGPSPSALYASAVLADLPLGYWRLEETTGTTAKDETGRHDGTYERSPMLGRAGAAGSRSIKLPNGVGSRISIPSAAYRFPDNLPYSVEAWVQPGTISDYQWIASTEVPVVTRMRNGWSVLCDAQGRLHYEVWVPWADGGDGSDQVRGSVPWGTAIPAGQLHHVVVVYDGAAVVAYVDGVKGTRQSMGAAAPNVGELFWGCRADFSYCLDDWTIDELAIYDHVMTENRIQLHYTLGK